MKIIIQNFQSHKDTTLELVPGVNALSGLSDVGKSAVIKAIHWVIDNSPAGDEFYSWWGGDSLVTLDFGDVAVTRTKGKGINAYKIKYPGRDEQTLTGFNQGVPDAVKEALNLRDFNLHSQHQSSFLLSDGGGAVNRYINRILDMEIIDRATSNIESDLRLYKGQAASEEQTAKRIEGELTAFNFLGEAEGRLAALEATQAKRDALEAKYNSLYDAYDEIKAINEKKQELRKVIALRPAFDEIMAINATIEIKRQRRSLLVSLIMEIKAIGADIEKKKKITKHKKEVEKLIAKNKKVLELTARANALESAINEIKSIEKMREENKIKIENLKKEFENLMPDVCPLCGRGGYHASHDA